MQNIHGVKVLETIKDCYTNEGVRGFFKGLSMPLANISFINAGSLAANEFARKLFKITDESKMTVMQSTYCGFIAGAAVTPIVTPVELVKCKLQMQKESKSTAHYKGVRDLLAKTYQLYGIRGIYRGNVTTILRETIGYATQFGVYHYLKLKLSYFRGVRYDELSSVDYILAGAVGGMSGWVTSYPFDTAKTIIQTGTLVSDDLVGKKIVTQDGKYFDKFGIRRYNYRSLAFDGGMVTCIKQVLYYKGLGGLFSGLLPMCVGTFLGNGAMFLVYEHSKQNLDRIFGVNGKS